MFSLLYTRRENGLDHSRPDGNILSGLDVAAVGFECGSVQGTDKLNLQSAKVQTRVLVLPRTTSLPQKSSGFAGWHTRPPLWIWSHAFLAAS